MHAAAQKLSNLLADPAWRAATPGTSVWPLFSGSPCADSPAAISRAGSQMDLCAREGGAGEGRGDVRRGEAAEGLGAEGPGGFELVGARGYCGARRHGSKEGSKEGLRPSAACLRGRQQSSRQLLPPSSSGSSESESAEPSDDDALPLRRATYR